jgi:hypothetical protein
MFHLTNNSLLEGAEWDIFVSYRMDFILSSHSKTKSWFMLKKKIWTSTGTS